jgi:osmotically-inducible protein OsmY
MNGSMIASFDIEQAKATLLQHLRGRIWDLKLELYDGRVILKGRTFSFYAKQLAQHAVMKSFGQTALTNEIEVLGHGSNDGPGSPSGP